MLHSVRHVCGLGVTSGEHVFRAFRCGQREKVRRVEDTNMMDTRYFVRCFEYDFTV